MKIPSLVVRYLPSTTIVVVGVVFVKPVLSLKSRVVLLRNPQCFHIWYVSLSWVFNKVCLDNAPLDKVAMVSNFLQTYIVNTKTHRLVRNHKGTCFHIWYEESPRSTLHKEYIPINLLYIVTDCVALASPVDGTVDKSTGTCKEWGWNHYMYSHWLE